MSDRPTETTKPADEGSTRPTKPAILGRWTVPFYYGWVIVGVVFVAELVASGLGGMTTPLFFQPIHEELGWSLTMFTGAATASSLAGIVVVPFLGPFLDRFGAKPLMLYGAIAAGVAMLFLARVQELWQFWVLYAFVGSLGLRELGSFTGPVVISKWFVRHRGRAMAISGNGVVLGGVIMIPVVGLLIDNVGWRNTWTVMAVMLMVVMVPMVLAFMRRQPEDMGLLPDGDEPAPQTGVATEGNRRLPREEESWTFREAVRTRSLWLLIASYDLMGLTTAVLGFHTVPYLTQQEGMSAAAAGLVLTLRLAGAAVSRIPWGFVLERVPIRYSVAAIFIIKSTGLLWLIAFPFPVNVIGFILSATIGGAQSIVQPMAFANYYGRGAQGAIQGITRPFIAVPTLVGPVLVAVLFDVMGTFDTAFIVASLLGIAGGIMALFATPPVRRTVPRAD